MIQFQHHFRKIHLLFIHFPVNHPTRTLASAATAVMSLPLYCSWGRDGWDTAATLLMAEIPAILHQLIGGLSHYLQGFWHPRWLFFLISSINTTSCFQTQSAKRNIFTSNIVNKNWLLYMRICICMYTYIYILNLYGTVACAYFKCSVMQLFCKEWFYMCNCST